jgi:hypothetical protein
MKYAAWSSVPCLAICCEGMKTTAVKWPKSSTRDSFETLWKKAQFMASRRFVARLSCITRAGGSWRNKSKFSSAMLEPNR